ncbi:transcriptional regulator [Nocardia brasiliensis]|uniref:Transcriptional regulator n=1 Tax=Nocardia brasiliensis TaxID=37326 RepID=A0A6G9XPC0_NOCBR|nr:transcriptional regulator [Nocardia brasiliensis]QIS02683.1 transcriptional regulator [Nocardia brasiliensis]
MEELNELFASVPRLKLVAFLDGCAEAEFLVIAEMCDLNKSTLSKAMTTLEGAGYLDVTKGYVGRKPRTWLALNPKGRTAYHAHLAALAALTRKAGQTASEP